MRGIQEAAALDPERLVAPRDLWFDEEGLNSWYEERNEYRESKMAGASDVAG